VRKEQFSETKKNGV